MARQPRYSLPGVPQHIIQRGNNRQAIFARDNDYEAYLGWLKAAADKHELMIHSYVLMANHMHLLATPKHSDSVGKVMQSLGRRYVGYFNSTYGRTGTLWEGRYRATIIDSESYLFVCSRYIELNPVRAGIVSLPERYRWSSYRSNADGRQDDLLTQHELYRGLGRTNDQRREGYRELFRGATDEATLDEIRRTTNKGWALGSDRFREEIENLTKRRAAPLQRGRVTSKAE